MTPGSVFAPREALFYDPPAARRPVQIRGPEVQRQSDRTTRGSRGANDVKHQSTEKIVRIMRNVILGGVLLASSSAIADSEQIYNYRSGVMKSIGGQMSSIVAIMKGQVFSENLATHAKAMGEMAEIAPSLFPEGSSYVESEALPRVWEEPAEFKKRMDTFVEAARKLASVAPAGDMAAIGPAVKSLGEACKGCHDDFRKKE